MGERTDSALEAVSPGLSRFTQNTTHTHTDAHTHIHICVYMRACMLSHFNCVQLFATLWSIAHHVPLSMGFSRQEYWSGLPFPASGDLSDPGIKPKSPVSPALHVDSLPAEPQGSL